MMASSAPPTSSPATSSPTKYVNAATEFANLMSGMRAKKRRVSEFQDAVEHIEQIVKASVHKAAENVYLCPPIRPDNPKRRKLQYRNYDHGDDDDQPEEHQQKDNDDDSRENTAGPKEHIVSKEVKKRHAKLLQFEDDEQYPGLRARDFADSIFVAYPKSGFRKFEDEQLGNMIRGYADNERTWKRVMKPLADISAQTWENMCDSANGVDATGAALAQQLFKAEKWTVDQADKQAIHQYIAFVLRLVVTLRFTILWEEHDDKPGGKKWKTEYIAEVLRLREPILFRERDTFADGSDARKKAEKKIKSAQEKLSRAQKKITTTNRMLLKAYRRYGPAVFFSRIWDFTLPKSKSFKETVVFLCDNPTMVHCTDQRQIPDTACRFEMCADSLFHILTYLGSVKVATFVQDFMMENPPEYGSEGMRWGLITKNETEEE